MNEETLRDLNGSSSEQRRNGTGYRTTLLPEALPVYEILYIFSVFGIVSIVRIIFRRWNIRFSCQVIIFLLGGVLGWVSGKYEHIYNIAALDIITPKVLLTMFLPAIIFNTAYSLDSHLFNTSLWQIVVISVPGYFISVVMMASCVALVFERDWPFYASLLFGAITSGTYPSDVSNVLRELGQAQHLGVILQGESLISDGTTIITCNILIRSLLGNLDKLPAFTYVRLLLQYVIGGPIFGWIVGKVTTFILPYFFNDPVSCVTLTMAVAYVSYFVGEDVMDVSGVLTVMVLGLLVAAERQKFPHEIDVALYNFWDQMSYLLNTLVFLMIGVLIADTTVKVMRMRDVTFILVVYTISTFIRFVMFFLLSPVITRLGSGVTWKERIVLCWSNMKGPVALCLILTVLHIEELEEIGEKMVIYVSALVILTLVINGSSVRTLMKGLGMSTISRTMRSNMNNAMRFLEIARDRSMTTLKTDKFLADANWAVVDASTVLIHPYRIKLSEMEDDDDEAVYLGDRTADCPECQREVVMPLTTKEFRDMSKEAKLRILKAKKVSYCRQYELGMLSIEGARILVLAIEAATDKADPVITVDDVNIKRKKSGFMFHFRNKLVTWVQPVVDEFQLPVNQMWRKKYFMIVSKSWFLYLVCLITLLNIVTIVVEVLVIGGVYSEAKHPIKYHEIFICIYTLFFLTYVAEVVIMVLAYGWMGYFRGHWNKFDFSILVLESVDVAVCFADLCNLYEARNRSYWWYHLATKFLRCLRLYLIFKVLIRLLPKLINFISYKLDVDSGLRYDVGKAFITGQDEICKMLPQIVGNKVVLEYLLKINEEDRLEATKVLGEMQQDMPWIAMTVKTRHAIRGILSHMKEAVDEMKEGGMLDEWEYNKLLAALDVQIQRLKASGSKSVQSTPPKVLLKELPWLVGDEIVGAFFLENAELQTYNQGDSIIELYDAPKALYILVSGLVKLTYIPTDNTLSNWRNFGALPNVDYFTSLNFEEKQEDYIVSGNVIGELGVLTNRPYDMSVTCETSVQAYMLSFSAIEEAFTLSDDISHGLQARMWKAVSIRIGAVILTSVPAYQSWSHQKIMYHLERAFVPSLHSAQVKSFLVNDLMEDILLIEGMIVDANTREKLAAPSYIPRTIHKILLPGNSMVDMSSIIETKLLIIPVKDADEFDVLDQNMVAFMPSETSSMPCHRHNNSSKTGRKGSVAAKKDGSGRRKRYTRNVGFARSSPMDSNKGYTSFTRIKHQTSSRRLSVASASSRQDLSGSTGGSGAEQTAELPVWLDNFAGFRQNKRHSTFAEDRNKKSDVEVVQRKVDMAGSSSLTKNSDGKLKSKRSYEKQKEREKVLTTSSHLGENIAQTEPERTPVATTRDSNDERATAPVSILMRDNSDERATAPVSTTRVNSDVPATAPVSTTRVNSDVPATAPVSTTRVNSDVPATAPVSTTRVNSDVPATAPVSTTRVNSDVPATAPVSTTRVNSDVPATAPVSTTRVSSDVPATAPVSNDAQSTATTSINRDNDDVDNGENSGKET